MCSFLGHMIQEGLAQVGVQATSTSEEQYYRIKFDSFPNFIDFFNQYFLPYRIEVNHVEKKKKNEPPVLLYRIEFAVEALPEELSDREVMDILIDLSKKIGFEPNYRHNAGICTVDLPFEACFVLFLELVQKLFKDSEV